MHANAHFQGFETCLLYFEADDHVRKFVEHDTQLSIDDGVQECYVVGHPNLRIAIVYKFHHKSPEHLDFRVDVLVDGVEIHRYLVKEHYHRLRKVDRVFRRPGRDVEAFALIMVDLPIPSDRPRQDSDDEDDDDDSDYPPLKVGTVRINVYRGQADKKTIDRELVVSDFEAVGFPRNRPVPATMRESPFHIRASQPVTNDGQPPISRGRFILDPRDTNGPWVSHIYKYRSRSDLKRAGIFLPGAMETEDYDLAVKFLDGRLTRDRDARISALEDEIRALRRLLVSRTLPTPPGTSSSSSSAQSPQVKREVASQRGPSVKPFPLSRTKASRRRRISSSSAEGFSGLTRQRAISVSSSEDTPGSRASFPLVLTDDSDEE